MPAAGIVLKAGWYKQKTDTVVVIGSTSKEGGQADYPKTSHLCYSIDYSKYFNDSADYYTIKIEAAVSLRGSGEGSVYTVYVDFYDHKQVSSNYLIETKRFENLTNSYKKVNFELTAIIRDDLYICFYSKETVQASSWNRNYLYLSDFYYTIYYPDTTNLYL